MEEKWDEGALERAQERADRVTAAVDMLSEARLRAAAKAARGSRKKLVWLQRAADVVVNAVNETRASACKGGCDHCCHIAVAVSEAEADAIAAATGISREANPVGGQTVLQSLLDGSDEVAAERRELANDRHSGSRCPFLGRDSRCRVYEVRPLNCRLHFSLSDDDRPCRLSGTEGGRTGEEVLYLNTLERRLENARVLGVHQLVADIRAWFPDVQEGRVGQAMPGAQQKAY